MSPSPGLAGGTEVYADMEQWTEIRRRVLTNEISKREACRQTTPTTPVEVRPMPAWNPSGPGHK